MLADELAAQPVGANGFEPAAMRPVIERLYQAHRTCGTTLRARLCWAPPSR